MSLDLPSPRDTGLPGASPPSHKFGSKCFSRASHWCRLEAVLRGDFRLVECRRMVRFSAKRILVPNRVFRCTRIRPLLWAYPVSSRHSWTPSPYDADRQPSGLGPRENARDDEMPGSPSDLLFAARYAKVGKGPNASLFVEHVHLPARSCRECCGNSLAAFSEHVKVRFLRRQGQGASAR